MITRIANTVYKLMRQHGRLSRSKAADAIGRERQIFYRLEQGEQLLNAKQEADLVKATNLSREAFVEIMCQALTEFLGRPVIVAPKGRYRPASPLMRADALYRRNWEKLGRRAKERIEAKLFHGRMLDMTSDQMASQYQIEIREIIEADLGPENVLGDADGE